MTNPEIPEPAPPTEPSIDTSAEQALQPTPDFAREQLKVITDYVTGATDRRLEAGTYHSARKRMDAVSEQAGGNQVTGRVAVTAATLGAMSRDPSTREPAAKLTRELMTESELPKDVVDIFWKVQDGYRTKPTPVGIGETLRSGLKFLDSREKAGVDVATARIAFKTSAFAATQDRGLREAIFRDLQRSTEAR